MKKMLLSLLAGVFILIEIPASSYGQCLSFGGSLTVTGYDSCDVGLQWTFGECVSGTYYIQYSSDNSNYYIIQTKSSTPGGLDEKTYTASDGFANPGQHIGGKIYYKITFVSSSSGSSYSSNTVEINLGSNDVECSGSRNSNRCDGLPSNLSISGPDVLCSGTSGFYTLSTSYPMIWSVSSGGSFITTSSVFGGGTMGVSNPGTNGNYATIATNVYGCRTLTKQISLGVPPDLSYYLNPSVNPFCTNSFGNMATVEPESYTPDVSFEWGYVDQFGSSGPVVVNSSGGISQDFIFSIPSLYQIYATARNTCGYFQGNVGTLDINATDCSGSGIGGLAFKGNKLGTDDGSLRISTGILSIYPNPVLNTLSIALPDTFNLDHGSIRILDVLGREIKRSTTSSFNMDIDVSYLKKGIYIISISDGKKSFIKKLVKQ